MFAGGLSVLALMLASGVISQQMLIAELHDQRRFYRSHQDLRQALDQIFQGMLNQQTGYRGYALSSDPAFLAPYQEGRKQYAAGLAESRRLASVAASDSASLLAALSEVEREAEQWQTNIAQALVSEVRLGNRQAALSPVTAAERRAPSARFDRFRQAHAQAIRLSAQSLANSEVTVQAEHQRLQLLTGLVWGGGILLASGLGALLIDSLRRPLRELEHTARAVAAGNLSVRAQIYREDEFGEFSRQFNAMLSQLENQRAELAERDVQAIVQAVGEILIAEQDLEPLLTRVLQSVCEHTNRRAGAMYLWSSATQQLQLRSSHGLKSEILQQVYAAGEGLAGSALTQARFLEGVEAAALTYPTLDGAVALRYQAAWPLRIGSRLIGVLLVAGLVPLSRRDRNVLNALTDRLAIAIDNALGFETIQQQQQELQVRERELAAQNEELEAQRSELEFVNAEVEAQRQRLERLNQELLASDRHKDEFLANMSHELRTPLNAIIGFSQLLLRREDVRSLPQVSDQLERILRNGRQQLRLVNDILDLARIRAGQVELHAEPVNLRELTEQTLSGLSPLAHERGLSIHLETVDPLPDLVTDPERLRQILTNLISNAIKYTDQGRITVYLGSSGLALDQIEIAVCDTGVGISADQQSLIFEAFRRLNQHPGQRGGGSGLGLAITSRLVQQMGGQIRLESAPGEGSTFRVILPRRPPTWEDATAPLAEGSVPLPVPAAPLSTPDCPRTILLIEHNLAVCSAVTRRLIGQPYRLLSAQDGPSGVELARRERPDLILLEVALPDSQFWQVLFELKCHPYTADIPLVLQGFSGERGLIVPLGLSAYLSKPVGSESLLQVLKRQGLSPQQGSEVLVVDDDPDVRQWLVELLLTEGYQVRTANNGEAALAQLEEALPRLVILDLMMPRLDGLEVLRCLRNLPGADRETVPVVILSALEPDAAQRRRLEQETELILRKGDLSPEALFEQLEQILDKSWPNAC